MGSQIDLIACSVLAQSVPSAINLVTHDMDKMHGFAIYQGERTISLSQTAYEAIKHKIVSLELAPGAVIDETDLREELELGRTPIREALQRLAMEKLVVIVPRRGTFVAEIGMMDLQRLFEARVVLEGLAANLASQRGSAQHWQRMTELLDSVSTSPNPIGNEDWIGIDEKCHQLIYQAADNKFLEDTLTTLYALSLRLWYYALSQMGDMRTAVTQHQSILAALQRRDAALAQKLMEEHIRAFQKEIQTVMVGQTSTLSVS